MHGRLLKREFVREKNRRLKAMDWTDHCVAGRYAAYVGTIMLLWDYFNHTESHCKTLPLGTTLLVPMLGRQIAKEFDVMTGEGEIEYGEKIVSQQEISQRKWSDCC